MKKNHNRNPDAKLPYPHYSESRWDKENTIFGNESDDLSYVYSDRLVQYDYDRHKQGEEKAKTAENNTARYWLEYLKGYYEKDIDLKWIGAGCNRSSGQPYWIFGYKISEE